MECLFMDILDFAKKNWLLAAIPMFLLMVIRMITERIIDRKATKLMRPLLDLIKKHFEEKVFKNEKVGKGPEVYYDWVDGIAHTITVNPGEVVEKIQELVINFGIIEDIYQKDLITRIFGFFWFIHARSWNIHEEIKNVCFEKLLKIKKLHKGKEAYTFIFKKKDNFDLFEKEELYSMIGYVYTGVIENINEDQKTIVVKMKESQKKPLTFIIDDTTKITKAGKEMVFSDLKPGMVSIYYKKKEDRNIVVTMDYIKHQEGYSKEEADENYQRKIKKLCGIDDWEEWPKKEE